MENENKNKVDCFFPPRVNADSLKEGAMDKSGVRLKVCGMKYQDNIQTVAKLKPDYLGFIFYEKSARFFEYNIPILPKSIKKTGVFVDADIEFVSEKIKKHDLQAVQLHGNESPEYLKKLINSSFERNRYPKTESTTIRSKVEIIKVFPIKDTFDFEVLKPYETICDYYLFDTKGKLPGGNGYAFDWSVLSKYPSTKPFFLSGGIGLDETENIRSFLEKKESKYCYAIDVNSKFEIEAGLKNADLLMEFKDALGF